MKKILFFTLVLVAGSLLSACGVSKTAEVEDVVYKNEQQPAIEKVKEIALVNEKTISKQVRGNCDSIVESSVCLDYLGELWTEEQMKLNCKDIGEYNNTQCPKNSIGGCRTMVDTEVETVIWSYSTGSEPVTPEILELFKETCGLALTSSWLDTGDVQ